MGMHYGKYAYSGPPRKTKEFIMAASRALQVGDWQRCQEIIFKIDTWNLIPGKDAVARVKAILAEKIKIEALRTYLFTYSTHYESFSLPQLCSMFDLEKVVAHSVVSKMMIKGELQGSWDQPTETIVLHKIDPTPLQEQALTFINAFNQLVENNESLLSLRVPGRGDGGHHRDRGDNDRENSNQDDHGKRNTERKGYQVKPPRKDGWNTREGSGEYKDFSGNDRKAAGGYNRNNNNTTTALKNKLSWASKK